MPRGKFGWDLPPGVTSRMIDQQFDEGICDCCGFEAADCICPECPVCHTAGDPNCYMAQGGHGLLYNVDQMTNLINNQMSELRMDLARLEQRKQFLAQNPGIKYSGEEI